MNRWNDHASVLDMVSWELGKESFEKDKAAYKELKAMVEK